MSHMVTADGATDMYHYSSRYCTAYSNRM